MAEELIAHCSPTTVCGELTRLMTNSRILATDRQ